MKVDSIKITGTQGETLYEGGPGTIEPVNEKTFKCQTCEAFLTLDKFYKLSAGRASPHCIACNPSAVQLQRYKKAIRTQGTKAFAEKIRAAERNIALMIQAQKEVQLTV